MMEPPRAAVRTRVADGSAMNQLGTRGGPPRPAGIALAVGCVVAAWMLCCLTIGTRSGHHLMRSAKEQVQALAPHGDLWVRLLRGGLGRITIPFLLVVTVLCVVAVLRQRRSRDAVVAVVFWLGANGTVESIKHGLVPFVPGHPQPLLSGHMGVVWGAVVAATLAAPVLARRRVVAWGAVAVAATAVGILLTAWHTPDQILAPLLLCAAWTLVVLPFAGTPRAPGPVADDDLAVARLVQRVTGDGDRPS